MSKKFYISLIVVAIISFVLGMEFQSYRVRSALTEGLSKMSESLKTNDFSSQKETTPSAIVQKIIGDTVELATLNIKVTSAEETGTLAGSYSGPKVAKEGAKFIIIHAEVINTTKQPFTFSYNSNPLVDEKGRRFGPYSDTIGAVTDYLDVRTLQPSITEKGVMVYEIAKDAEKYKLVFLKAGTNEEYDIVLK